MPSLWARPFLALGAAGEMAEVCSAAWTCPAKRRWDNEDAHLSRWLSALAPVRSSPTTSQCSWLLASGFLAWLAMPEEGGPVIFRGFHAVENEDSDGV